MSNREHKLISNPVSVNDGLKQADAKTWKILGLTAVATLVIVVAINLFLPREKVDWPDSPRPAAAQPEPKTYDVVPRRQPKPSE
ncbi:MAG: hypothetical protein ACK6DM_08970 [Alphaproteobacteria bacterium]|jgi:hypothetical protein